MSSRSAIKHRFLLELFRRFKRNESSIHALTYLFWECTLRCNLKCLHCGSDCKADASTADMPAKDLLLVTQKIRQAYPDENITVVLTGGEPLLRPDLAEIGYQLRKQGLRWSMVTNGMALTEAKLTELVNAGIGAITISLDGLEPEHNWLRNHPSSYAKAVKAIEAVAKIPRINSDVVTCVNNLNLKDLEAIQEVLQRTGIRSWRLFTITPIGRAAGNKDLALSGTQYKELLDFIAGARKKKTNPIASFSCETYTGEYEGAVRDGYFFCRAGINIASILADGSISACPNNDPSLIQGNIYRDDFLKIWNEKFAPFRNRRWTKTNKCAQCKQYKYCEGGGLHSWNFAEKVKYDCHCLDS